MNKKNVQGKLEQQATRAILTHSIYRWESAVIIALTAGLAIFSRVGVIPSLFPFWRWWFWLVLGGVGEVALIWSSLQDSQFRAQAVAEMFRSTFETREIEDKKLRAEVNQALEYRDRIDEAIGKAREGALRDHLRDVSQGVTNWVASIFQLAKRLDAYAADETIRRDLQAVEPAIQKLKERLAQEDDDTVKRQISQAVAQRQIQRDNLRKLENVMERAEFQLESTLTAMGTVYSQMILLSAADVASGRAQRLQQDISDQIQSLQDVVQTMDEVYHAGVDSQGLGSGTTQSP